MAWQTPKTNWSSADGVRDTDFNRIEGNILELYDASGLKTNKTVYVHPTTGNDETGAGTSASPYATIAKALSVLPRNTESYDAFISLGSGIYNENVTIKGFTGKVVLTGASSGQVTVNSLTVDGCVCMVNSITLKAQSSGTAITVTNCGALLCTSGNLAAHNTSTGTICVNVSNGSTLLVANTLTCTGVGGGTGLSCNACSRAHVYTLAGNNKANGMEAGNGSILSYVVASMTVSGTLSLTFTGGRIYSGAQTSVPVY